MALKPEYKMLQILKKDNDYFVNLANLANIKIHVKALSTTLLRNTKFKITT